MANLNLPEYEQVVFGEAPLEEVICQLRFNQILKIASAPPADFQDRIRKQFPAIAEERGIEVGIARNQPVFTTTSEPAWQFKTIDDEWVVSLTSEFIALKTTAYTDFEDFLERLRPLLKAFEEVYEPPCYTRVGLRYVNRFFLQREADKAVAWEKHLNKHLSGAYTDPVLRDGIAEAKHYFVLRRDPGIIGWRYSRDVGQADGKPAERFTLDFDHYLADNIACEDVLSLLIKFNDSLYRLFRWCLTVEGYESLKPKPKTSSRARKEN